MGTVVSFDVRAREVPSAETRAAIARACRVLRRADDVFSVSRLGTVLSDYGAER